MPEVSDSIIEFCTQFKIAFFSIALTILIGVYWCIDSLVRVFTYKGFSDDGIPD